MILLLGGTSDMVPIANLLIGKGLDVCVSTLTGDLDTKNLVKTAKSIVGELSLDSLTEFVRENKVTLILDATHPYASVIRKLAFNVATECGIPHVRFEREETSYHGFDVSFCHSHIEAADLARKLGKNHLLTIGSRFLGDYKNNFNNCNVFARVLNSDRSIEESLDTGISKNNIIAKRGPFTFDQNVETLKQYNIDVLITKDGGSNAKVIEKLEACRSLGVSIILVLKPRLEIELDSYSNYEYLISRVCNILEQV